MALLFRGFPRGWKEKQENVTWVINELLNGRLAIA